MPNEKAKGKETVPSRNITLSSIPEGYVVVKGPDQRDFVVPSHLVPDIEFAFESYRQKIARGVEQEAQSFTTEVSDAERIRMSDIFFPPNPPLSPQERRNLHENVLALQTRLGISYKDAAHRLYMAEVEKTKMADQACKALAALHLRLEISIKQFNQKFRTARKQGPPEEQEK